METLEGWLAKQDIYTVLMFIIFIFAIIMLIINIYKRKKAEEMLIKTQQLLDEVRLQDEITTEFFTNVSHELRTPLNVMLSSIQLIELYIQKGMIKEEGVSLHKKIDVIKQNSLRLLKLINNLIDITKMNSGFYELQLKNCNIVSVVEESVLSMIEYVESRNIECIFDTEVEEMYMNCDPEKIERVMLNLLSNAAKFTPKDGKIYVNVYQRKDKVEISVKDTGIGIAKDKQKIIFDRFKQIEGAARDSKDKGSGLGLYLVKSMVELHNGNIKLKSEIGKGSEFIVTFPIENINETHSEINREPDKEVERQWANYEKNELSGLELSDLLSGNVK
ncbi:HAMP domain-containing sensor histidine kinase [Clostridium sp. HMP27]|uniref:sensor histidine kinase n=1 Tax=Clostridium sp. HMP27 TaxID=1487921 RepID=UPI000689E75D|nr:HAMP domain-containing sensor histidine kinase [Clostridium sp. HMP27]